MNSALAHTPTLLWNYLTRGQHGIDEVADRLHEAAHDQPNGKFDKDSAVYLPQTPFPPVLWRNQCGRCRFWQEGGPGESGQCHIVGQPDDDYGGEAIHPRGWCALYTPPSDEPAFAWIRERLHPDGASSVRGRYDPTNRRKRQRQKQDRRRRRQQREKRRNRRQQRRRRNGEREEAREREGAETPTEFTIPVTEGEDDE